MQRISASDLDLQIQIVQVEYLWRVIYPKILQ